MRFVVSGILGPRMYTFIIGEPVSALWGVVYHHAIEGGVADMLQFEGLCDIYTTLGKSC